MCDHENREAAMTVLAPGIWCDPCIAPLVKALNDGGLVTIASCCGHGYHPSRVTLADGRTLFVADPEWTETLSRLVHDEVGCKPGYECANCAQPDADGEAS